MIEFNCVYCEKPFSVYPSRAKTGATKYCSKACKFEHFKVKETNKRTLIKCDHCEKEFLRYNYHSEKNEKNYCSYECMGKAKEKLEEVACEHCAKPFLAKSSRNKLYQARFCSMECRQNHYKYDHDGNVIDSNRVCGECGERFIARRDEIRRGKGLYCSSTCKYKAKEVEFSKENRHFYGSSKWRKLRDACRKEYNYTCQWCGVYDKSVHAHHLIPRMYDGPDELSNLIALCNTCHIKADWLLRKALKKS